MTKEQLCVLPDNPPVILKDGLIGLLLVWPTERSAGERAEQAGIQVPGEKFHRRR